MPTLLEHVAIAGFVVLALTKKPKWALLLCWVAILPDFDIFFGLHRMAFHSLLLLLPISLAIIGIAYGWFPNYKEPAFIIAFYLLSHTILDYLQSWNALLWPIPLAFWLNITITILPTSPIPTPHLVIGPMVAPIEVLYAPSTGSLVGPLDAFIFLLFLTVAFIRIWPDLPKRLLKPFLNTDKTTNQSEPADTDIAPIAQTHPASPTSPSDPPNTQHTD